MELNKLRDRVYDIACRHGWHDENKSNRHWLCLVISELMEAVEADRIGKNADVDTFRYIIEDDLRERHLFGKEFDNSFLDKFQEFIKDSIEDELADACIRLFDYAGVIDFDLDDYDYVNSDADDYSEMTFTESMYNITSHVMDYDCEIYVILNEIFAFCRHRNIDIMWHIEQKIKYNELRPYKHGKLY